MDRLVIAIQHQSYEEIVELFDSIGPLNSNEARKITKKVYRHFHKKYPSDFHTNSKNSLMLNFSLLACKRDQTKRINCLDLICLDPYSLLKRRSAHHSDYENKLFSASNVMQMVKVSSFLLNCVEFNEEDIPTDLVIGGIEILVGSLIWILPFPGQRVLEQWS